MERTVPTTLCGGTGGGGGRTSNLQVTCVREWGQNQTPPKKIPRASNKTPKIPGPNINPQKILCRISKARFGCTLFRGYGVTNLQIVLNTPPPPPKKKNPYLLVNQSTQKNTRQVSLPKKIQESKISNPNWLAIIYHSLRLRLKLPFNNVLVATQPGGLNNIETLKSNLPSLWGFAG